VSEEHNVRTNLREREAAIARGGEYGEGYLFKPGSVGGLQMSRALGDNYLEGVLSREPATDVFRIGAKSIVIVASDGVFDPNHKESPEVVACELVGLAQKGHTAPELLATRKGFRDNATLLLWQTKSGA
jgi:serine/threonine protein phosphatase PrpC